MNENETKPTFRQRFNKAITAAFWGGVAAVGTGFTFTGAPTKDQVGKLIGLFIAGAFLAGFPTAAAKKNAELPK